MALLREVLELPHARVEVQQQEGLLFIVETGQIKTLAELGRYTTAMDSIIRRTSTDRAVIDARGEIGDPPAPVRQAMWSWIMDPGRGFSVLAFVLPTEMAIARVNMTALSQGARVRAFDSVFAAQRWIARGPRFSTQTMRTPSSRPPPMAPPSSSPSSSPSSPSSSPSSSSPSSSSPSSPPAGRPRRDTARGPGFYSSSTTPVDRLPQGTPAAPSGGSGREPDKAMGPSRSHESDFRATRPTGTRSGGGESGGGSQVA